MDCILHKAPVYYLFLEVVQSRERTTTKPIIVVPTSTLRLQNRKIITNTLHDLFCWFGRYTYDAVCSVSLRLPIPICPPCAPPTVNYKSPCTALSTFPFFFLNSHHSSYTSTQLQKSIQQISQHQNSSNKKAFLPSSPP